MPIAHKPFDMKEAGIFITSSMCRLQEEGVLTKRRGQMPRSLVWALETQLSPYLHELHKQWRQQEKGWELHLDTVGE